MGKDLKTHFEAKEIPIFALATKVIVKSDFAGNFSIVSVDEIFESHELATLQQQIPLPEIPTQPEKLELFNWRFEDDEDEFSEDVMFNDSPAYIAGEGTDMDIFGTNYVIFWIVPADKDKLLKAFKDALAVLQETEEDETVLAALLLENYISRIYFIQNTGETKDVQVILEEVLEAFLQYLKEDTVNLMELHDELAELLGFN